MAPLPLIFIISDNDPLFRALAIKVDFSELFVILPILELSTNPVFSIPEEFTNVNTNDSLIPLANIDLFLILNITLPSVSVVYEALPELVIEK